MVFECDAWYLRRRSLEQTIGEDISPDSLLSTMLKNKANWSAVSAFVKEIMSKKEEEERLNNFVIKMFLNK